MHFKGGVAEDPEAGKMLLPSDPPSGKTLAFQGYDLTSKLSLIAALAYGIASMAMVFINKAVLLQYPHSMTLLILQQLTTAVLIHVGKSSQLVNVRSMDWKTSKRLLPLSLFYNANVAFALASLKGVNIPMYIALKRLTPLAVLITGFFFGKAKPSNQVSLAVLLTGLGVIIAALGDFSFDPMGYTLALVSVAFQTAYLVLVERSAAEDGLSSLELMLYNAVLSLPFLVLLIYGTNEFPLAGVLLLRKDCSSGACERNWSSYSLIHTKIRNCLTTRQLERLVYCRANMRMVEELHMMDISKQVNVDTFKLKADTLESVQKERDSSEMEIYAQLFRELEEIDFRISRTRSGRGRGRRATPIVRRVSTGPATYVRRGSGSSSAIARHEDDIVADLREPEYDDDGNVLSEGDYGLLSSVEASSEDDGSSIHTDTSEDEASR